MSNNEDKFINLYIAGYTIIKPLKAGNVGSVYIAKNEELDELRAVKFISKERVDAKPTWEQEIKKVVKLKQTEGVVHYHTHNFIDIEDEEEAELCNSILKELGFPVSFNSDISDIYKAFGKEDFTEDHIIGCTRYIYSPGEELYIAFDISGNKITGMEIVCSKELIESILN